MPSARLRSSRDSWSSIIGGVVFFFGIAIMQPFPGIGEVVRPGQYQTARFPKRGASLWRKLAMGVHVIEWILFGHAVLALIGSAPAGMARVRTMPPPKPLGRELPGLPERNYNAMCE